MERYFIYAILLYTLVVVIYMLWERSVKRRQNAARKKAYNPFKAPPKEDIIGKSKFTLRHSKQEATTLEMNDNKAKNTPIFASENRQTATEKPLVEVLQSEIGTGKISTESENNSGEIDLIIDNEPEGELEPDDEGDLDTWESEVAEDETGGSIARGIGFEELASMTRTVGNAENATAEEREEAGRVLVEVRMTEIINQVAPDEPKKKVVSSLMDEYFTAYYRKTEAQPEPAVKAPTDFSVRGFA
ncbi:hypothetical protein LJC38_02590 [Parabacteroides sp. OttesenSCG-928-K15]|nr:hypothetical protein [Parabacteroides sp. OttesenSCG-928-K15]